MEIEERLTFTETPHCRSLARPVEGFIEMTYDVGDQIVVLSHNVVPAGRRCDITWMLDYELDSSLSQSWCTIDVRYYQQFANILER